MTLRVSGYLVECDGCGQQSRHSRETVAEMGWTTTQVLLEEFDWCPACTAHAAQQAGPRTFDLVAHLHRQRSFSEHTFGPGMRTRGVVDHIRKELAEIEQAPGDLAEWIDVVLLALDGAWRSGATPEQIAGALLTKQARNEAREWPDWRTADPDRAIEHVRE